MQEELIFNFRKRAIANKVRVLQVLNLNVQLAHPFAVGVAFKDYIIKSFAELCLCSVNLASFSVDSHLNLVVGVIINDGTVKPHS